MQEFTERRVETKNTHGTGDTLSSAIATYLALGEDLSSAIAAAKSYLTEALQRSGELQVGNGHGPVLHFHARDYGKVESYADGSDGNGSSAPSWSVAAITTKTNPTLKRAFVSFGGRGYAVAL